MKKILALAAFALLVSVTGAMAQPQAKEIAFTASCAKGVHVYDKTTDAVTCGKPAMSGTGYVIEMATDANGVAQCPKGYNYIGHVQGSQMGGSLQHFACVKS